MRIKKPYKYRYFRIENHNKYGYFKIEKPYIYGYSIKLAVNKVHNPNKVWNIICNNEN